MTMNPDLIKGLIIHGHILLSDKNQRGECDQNTRGSSAPEVVFGHIFARVFVRQQYMTSND